MAINLGHITQGKDTNFFQKVTINSAAFKSNCDIYINIRGTCSFTMINEGLGTIEYSFNGSTLHGDMIPGTPTEALFFDNRVVSKIWFRTAAGPNIVRIEAWARS
ncbi:MAG: hypothetical protein Q8O87_04165 [bacterium]|nr:hypothetical protein [bacterium]